MNHHARVVCTNKALGHSTGARRVDDVSSRLSAYQRVQPGTPATDMPAGFVGDDPCRLGDGLADRIVDRLAAPRRS
jgi:hypothetical protein